MAPDQILDTHPQGSDWRADALAGSRHSRLADHLVQPIESHDVEQAAVICAQVGRTVLGDLAPALILLHPEWRQRVQALTAYGLTLFDFAKQTGLEGESLSQINRWEFELEAALSGKPSGQPVFVLLATEHSDPTLAGGSARSPRQRRPPSDHQPTAVDGRPPSTGKLCELGGAIVASLVEDGRYSGARLICRRAPPNPRPPGPNAHSLRRHQATLPVDELADSWDPGSKADGRQLDLVIGGECERIRALLADASKAVSEAPPPMRSAAAYLLLAGRRLLAEIEERGAGIVDRPPQLGFLSRVGLLLRARWGKGLGGYGGVRAWDPPAPAGTEAGRFNLPLYSSPTRIFDAARKPEAQFLPVPATHHDRIGRLASSTGPRGGCPA